MKQSTRLIKAMNQYYEARSPWHDEYMSYESIEDMEARHRPIIKTLEEIINDRNVLEIACGTGNWTQVVAKRADSLVAIDVSPGALKIARKKLSGYSNVTMMQGDAYDLDNVGGSFDVVFAADWWSHIPKGMVQIFLESVCRKLVKGSNAVFLDMCTNEYFKSEPCYFDEDSNRVSLRKLPDESEYNVVKNFPSEAELRQILADFGCGIRYYEFTALQRWMVVFEPN